MIRPHFVLYAALAAFTLTGGCTPQPTPQPQNGLKPIHLNVFNPVADDLGRPVALKAPAQRIAVIGPGATEVIFALGAADRLVGRDMYSNYPPETNKIKIMGDSKGPFFEQTLALRPDLIILQGETYDQVRADDWTRKLKTPVAVINTTNIKGLAADVEKIGAWLGLDEKARLLTKVPPLSNKSPLSAFIEIQRAPLWTAGGDTLVGDALRAAGLVNVAEKTSSYKAYNLESLLAQKPEVYIVTDNPAKRDDILQDLRKRPGLKDLDCIKRGRVAIVDADLLLRPGPRLWKGIRILAEEARKK